MKLNIKNLGPITNATIDLNKRFYTFVGYNNSGKSYMAQLLWALWNTSVIQRFNSSHYAKSMSSKYALLTGLSPERKITNTEKYEILIENELVWHLLNSFLQFIYEDYIYEIFNLPKNHPSLSNLRLGIQNLEEFDFLSCDFYRPNVAHDGNLFGIIEIIKNSGSQNITVQLNDVYSLKTEPGNLMDLFDFIEKNQNVSMKSIPVDRFLIEIQDVFDDINDAILSGFLGNFKPYYLPATRVYHSSFFPYVYKFENDRREELFKSLRSGKMSMHDFVKNESSYKEFYTSPVSFLTKSLFEMTHSHVYETSEYKGVSYFQDKMKTVFSGDIDFVESNGLSPRNLQYQFVNNNDQQIHLDMYMASSMVNQLATLHLYFKYWARSSSNFLIIDEPEVNLHAKQQLAFLDILMEFASINNNRVLITTHSPIMAKSINNHINLGKFKHKPDILHKLMDEIGLHREDPDSILSNEDFGVYFFSGTEVVEYEDSAYGVHFKDFDAEQYKVDKANELITDYLYYEEESVNE